MDRVSDTLKFALVTGLAAISVLVSAETVVMVSNRLPELRAAKAEAPIASLTTTAPMAAGQGQIAKSSDGHYWAEGQVNGAQVRFLVDTGASKVSLTPQDAQRLGLDLTHLAYDQPVRTADGESLAARVRLKTVTVNGVRVADVDALVIDRGLPASLLGMSYLGRLSRFEATPRSLVLDP